MKHWIIAANLGNDMSMEILKKGFKKGMVSKEDFAAALRAHQAAVDATKSPQREKGEAAKQRWRYRSKCSSTELGRSTVLKDDRADRTPIGIAKRQRVIKLLMKMQSINNS